MAAMPSKLVVILSRIAVAQTGVAVTYFEPGESPAGASKGKRQAAGMPWLFIGRSLHVFVLRPVTTLHSPWWPPQLPPRRYSGQELLHAPREPPLRAPALRYIFDVKRSRRGTMQAKYFQRVSLAVIGFVAAAVAFGQQKELSRAALQGAWEQVDGPNLVRVQDSQLFTVEKGKLHIRGIVHYRLDSLVLRNSGELETWPAKRPSAPRSRGRGPRLSQATECSCSSGAPSVYPGSNAAASAGTCSGHPAGAGQPQ
jgi:hypothetical protein